LDSLDQSENELKRSWPYTESVTFVEDINLKRRIQHIEESTMTHEKQQPLSQQSTLFGSWLNDNVVMLPMLVAILVVLLGLAGFGCFLLFVTKFQAKPNGGDSEVRFNSVAINHNNGHQRQLPAAIIKQNARDNAIKLTPPPTKQLLRQSNGNLVPISEKTELHELDHLQKCLCKNPSGTLLL
jgi:hypothetical protein